MYFPQMATVIITEKVFVTFTDSKRMRHAILPGATRRSTREEGETAASPFRVVFVGRNCEAGKAA